MSVFQNVCPVHQNIQLIALTFCQLRHIALFWCVAEHPPTEGTVNGQFSFLRVIAIWEQVWGMIVLQVTPSSLHVSYYQPTQPQSSDPRSDPPLPTVAEYDPPPRVAPLHRNQRQLQAIGYDATAAGTAQQQIDVLTRQSRALQQVHPRNVREAGGGLPSRCRPNVLGGELDAGLDGSCGTDGKGSVPSGENLMGWKMYRHKRWHFKSNVPLNILQSSRSSREITENTVFF